MRSFLRPILLACLFVGIDSLVLDLPVAQAQDVQPATHVQALPPTTPDAAQSVQFAQQPAIVGDRVTQQVAMELDLQTSIVQSQQVAQQQETQMKRGQRREVEVLEVRQGQVRRARVSFPHSRHQLPEHGDKGEQIQPVEGKSYELTRTKNRLLVKYLDGTVPPQDEFTIVLSSMHSLGLPNPLAEFLLDRSFQVGQTIRLPKEIAESMLGFGPEFGEITSFELTLEKTEEHHGHLCAFFQAAVQLGQGTNGSVSLEATGPVIIRLDTCRTVLADFGGSLRMTSQETTPGGSFQHLATGTIRVAVRSDYAR